MLRRWLAFAVAGIAVVLVWNPTSAYADGGCPAGSAPVQTQGGVLCVVVTDPGTPAHPGLPGNPGNGADQSPGCFKHNGGKVPCVTELGVWWSGSECYAERYNAPPGSPAWQGHSDGSLWMCSTCLMVGTTSTCHADVIWMAPGQAPGPPDPGQLASVAVGVMPLDAGQRLFSENFGRWPLLRFGALVTRWLPRTATTHPLSARSEAVGEADFGRGEPGGEAGKVGLVGNHLAASRPTLSNRSAPRHLRLAPTAGQGVEMESPLLRVPEVVVRLGVSRAKVYEFMASGDLRSVRVGGSRRIRVEDLDQFIAGLDDVWPRGAYARRPVS